MTWICNGCTFENITSKSELYCEMCQSQRPFGVISCSQCTYFNPAASLNCEMCGFDLKSNSKTIADCLLDDSPKKRKLSVDGNLKSRKHAKDDDLEIISITPSNSRVESNKKLYGNSFAGIKLKWDGCVEMTACPGSTSTLTMQSILDPTNLVYAAFSSYCIDNEWLMSFLPPHLPWTIFNQRPKDMDPETVIMNIAPGKKLVFPKLKGAFGCMHIKFMILFYEDRCRFVLPSANIVDYDWSKIENIVYYQDFPLGTPTSSSKFQNDLISTLEHMQSPRDIIDRLRNYDFSMALGSLILSRPGSFPQSESQKFGQEALAVAVKDLCIKKTNESYSYCQSSSLGALNQKWLDEFTSCVNGLNYNQKLLSAKLKIVFPSDRTVKDSILGPANGGTIFAQRKLWNSPGYPKAYVADCNSTSSKALMHSKIIIHANCQPKSDFLEFTAREDEKKDGYIYMGSHNHTQAAWGKWQVRKPVLTISNWELGIVIPVKFGAKGFKIPFKIPPAEYSQSDFPWFNQVDFGSINRLKASFKK